jgi:hypothetical protein
LTAGANDDPPFFLLATRLHLVREVDELIADIAGQLSETAPTLIVLDTLNRTLVGSESRDEDMSAYIAACDYIRERFKCAVLIVHHCGLETSRPRGHTSLIGAADAQIAVTKGDDGLIRAEVEYMKDGPDGAILGGRRVEVKVGVDENGKPITSCVVEDVDSSSLAALTTKTKRTGRPPRHRELMVQALENAISKAGVERPSPSSLEPIRAARIDTWRECYYELSPVAGDDKTKKDNRKRNFARAATALINKDPPIVGADGEHAWLVGGHQGDKRTPL